MNKLLRKLNMMSLSRRNGRRRKRRVVNTKNKLPPILSKKPQKYGAGTTVRYISFFLDVRNVTLETFNLGTLLENSQEYNEIAVNYSYVRLEAIKLIVRPYNFTNTAGACFFKMNWSNALETADSVLNSDVSKMVGAFNPRGTVFTFIPPTISYGGAAIPSFYVQTLATNYIFVLNAYSSIGSTIKISIEIAVRFRTPRDYSQSSNKIKELKKQIIDEVRKLQENEENKNKEELVKINEEILKEDDSISEDSKENHKKKNKKKKRTKEEDIKEE